MAGSCCGTGVCMGDDMTEDEARQKWCPMVRVTITRNDATWQGNMLTNRGQIPAANTDTLCIASDCMMWKATDNEIKENAQGPIEDGHAMKASDYVAAGYCGLVK